MIDLWKIPPNRNFTQNHAKACKPGKGKTVQNNQKNEICPCCFNIISKEEVPLCQNSKELQFLGFGIPLYFIFVKYCIVLLIVLITTYNGYAMYKSISDNQDFCSHRRLGSSSDPHCTSFFILFSQVQYKVTISEVILRIFSFLLHLFTLIYIRDSMRKIYEYYDQRTTSLSDYSFLIKKLPQIIGIQKSINNFIHNHFKQDWQKMKQNNKKEAYQKQQKVMKIILLPDLDQYYQLQEEKKKLINLKKKILQSQIVEIKELQKNDQQLTDINYKIKAYCQKQKNMATLDELISEQAIVIVNLQSFKDTVIKYAENNSLNSQLLSEYFGQFQGQLEIIEAPQPKQIIWKNINYPISKKVGRIFLGWFLTVTFLVVITVIFYFLLRAKTNYLLQALEEQSSHHETAAHADMNSALALVYIIIILIILFNKLVLGWVLHYFAHIQKHFSTSDEEFSFAFKYTLGLFFTTAIMTLAVEAVSFHNFYSHQYGVIEQQGIMFFMNAFFVPIIWLINPWHLFALVKRKFTKTFDSLTQWEANQLMEDVQYTVGKRYAQVIQIMWFTFLYATLIPFGAMLSVLGLGLYYWVDKYNLLRKSSLKSNISGELTFFSLKLLDFTLMLRPIGQLIFDSQIRDGVSPESIAFVIIGFIYLLLPMNYILDIFHDQQYRLEQKSYEQVKDNFLETYATFHPIIKQSQGKLQKRVLKHASSVLDFSFQTLFNTQTNTEIQMLVKKKNNNSINSLNSFSSTLIPIQPSRDQLQKVQKMKLEQKE